MTSKLFVTNLSASSTLSSVRQCFAVCGEVVDVEFLAERSGRPASAAYVTLATGAAAARAVNELHGALLHDRMLVITVAPGSTTRDRRVKTKPEAAASVQIAQQYRDRHGMFYELDSAGLPLTLKFVFPQNDGDAWRVQAATKGEQLGDVEASALSRELALTALSEQCGRSPTSVLAGVRWLEVADALRSVRAI
jgi:RNA recognition motif-containing protein